MEILKLKTLEHSGIGKNAIHKKVLNSFRINEKEGIKYCEKEGYDVVVTDILLTVEQKGEYGFKMSALIKR